jgi:hypothetical protein
MGNRPEGLTRKAEEIVEKKPIKVRNLKNFKKRHTHITIEQQHALGGQC